MKRILFAFGIIMMLSSAALAEELRIDYDRASGDLYGYLETLLDDVSPENLSDEDLAGIADYIEYAVDTGAAVELSGNDAPDIDGDQIKAKSAECDRLIEKYEDLLYSKGIMLNRELNPEVTVFLKDCFEADDAELNISYESLEKLTAVGRIKLVYGEHNEYVSFSGSDAEEILKNYRRLGVQIKQTDEAYSVRFLDERGAVVSKYAVSLKLGLPSQSDRDTVYIFYNNDMDNWGGQYNPAYHLIEFLTPYSGDYSVSGHDPVMSDIDGLSEYEKKAAEFMVTRQYFEADNGLFRPDDRLSRYDFTKALVRMLFAIDNEAETTFSDVDEDNYRYVAASEKREIVEGFEDHTFRGGLNATGEQVIVLTARTIHEQKGYIYPDNTDIYLSFDAGGAVPEWARREIALAVREGIYDPKMQLKLNQSISRKDASTILYRLFMILNNTPQKPVNGIAGDRALTGHKSFYTTRNTIIVVVITMLIDAAVVFVVTRRMRKKSVFDGERDEFNDKRT